MRDTLTAHACRGYPQASIIRCMVGPAAHLHYLVDHYSVLDICQVICTEERGIVHAMSGDFKAHSSLPNVILLLLIRV